MTPLHYACQRDSFEIVKYLVLNRAFINELDSMICIQYF